MIYLTALLVGLGGSLHCVAMCGPLALITDRVSGGSRWLNRLLYNGGRIFTYGIMGLVVGATGAYLHLDRFQSWFSVSIGVLMLLSLAGVRFLPGFSRYLSGSVFNLKKALGSVLRKPHGGFLVGVLNGLLPCGLVYLALGLALAATTSLQGVVLMMAFGLGTVPAMLGVLVSREAVQRWFPRYAFRARVVMLVVAALLLVGRGVAAEVHRIQGGDTTVVCH